jgi:hypothetical protein
MKMRLLFGKEVCVITYLSVSYWPGPGPSPLAPYLFDLLILLYSINY